jgi:hypothetical protein
MLAIVVVIGVANKRSRFASDTKIENRKNLLFWAKRKTVLEKKKNSISYTNNY